MSLLERAREDIKTITTDLNGFAVSMVFIIGGTEYPPVTGLHTKHHLGFNAELQKWANVKNAHISVAESEFIRIDYPLRNAAGEVFMQYHKVRVADSTGEERLYNVDQWFPDETVGLIMCILGAEAETEDE